MKKVLLVDDDPIANFIHKSVLEECSDFQVQFAENGKEALDVLTDYLKRGDCPDLILLDLNMPVMNGHEFLEELEKSPDKKKVRIVVLSSSNSKTDIEMSGAKVQGFITKPLTEDKFQQILNIINQ